MTCIVGTDLLGSDKDIRCYRTSTVAGDWSYLQEGYL